MPNHEKSLKSKKIEKTFLPFTIYSMCLNILTLLCFSIIRYVKKALLDILLVYLLHYWIIIRLKKFPSVA